jgi:putative transposase
VKSWGCQVGDSETEEFWTEFLRDLRSRGLAGVQLVISDAHAGLVAAVGAVLQGAAWQRCRVHFMRNVLTKVPKGDADMVATWTRTIFTMGNPKAVRAQLDHVAKTLQSSHPRVAEMLRDAKADVTAFSDFPLAHWRKIWSTNPLERLNKEVKRRTDVVGIFPNPAALHRLTASVLIEAHDEWQVADRRYLSEASMAQLNPPTPSPIGAGIGTAADTPREVIDTPAALTA